MFTEDDLLPISALQHLLYCPRQCALIHLERLWSENRLTVEGRQLHQRADSKTHETRPGIRIARSLQLRSYTLGLYGVADVVEFRPNCAPYPVEYKRGRPKSTQVDQVQLCAQALCLEEMLHTTIPAGALYYGKTRRRVEIPMDSDLRALAAKTAADLHALLNSGHTPSAMRDDKCERCSLLNLCMPHSPRQPRSAAGYVAQALVNWSLPGGSEESS